MRPTPGTPDSRPPPAPTPGGTPGAQPGRAVQPHIPGYELLGELGRGAHGAVLRARELQTGRQVAIKLLLGSRLEGTHVERFRREGELTARLDHPGIVRVHGGGLLSGNLPYLVYELVDGGTLADALPSLDRDARLRLLLQACRAVGHAHARGVVHRDLKPQNMLVDSTGTLRVADFGIGAGEGLTRLTATGALLGTPTHAAPEQLSGDRARVGPPSDVWSLGVILYQLLTNELPFVADGYMALLAEVTRAPPAPRRLDPTISRAVEAVCLRALAPDPAARPQTGDALADALEAALAAPPPPPPWRRPAVLAGGAGGLVVAVALAMWTLRPRDPPAPPVVAAPTEVAPVPSAPLPAPDVPALPPELRALGERAAAGEPLALLELGRVLHRGAGVPRDRDAGRVWLLRAAKAGELEAARRLLDDPLTPRETVAELRGVLERLAREESPPALALWARALTDGRGGRRDPRRAVALLRRANELGHVPAKAPLALLLQAGDGVERDEAAALELLEQGAAQGDVVAQRELGRCHLDGEGAPRDEGRAVQLLGRAADQGDAPAMVLLSRGEGDDRWLERAAELGDTLAMVLLADGGDRMRWLRRAAEEGEVRAMYQLWLALCDGTPADYAEGLALYRRAAELDDELCGALANELYRGEGRLPVDKVESLQWFGQLAVRAPEWVHGAAQSSELSDPAWSLALYSLLPDDPRSLARRALLVEEGRGAPRSYERSSALWRRAAELGDPGALLALGERQRNGAFGVAADPAAAVRNLEAAAATRDAPDVVANASARLASIYLERPPRARDPTRGRMWAERAAARDQPDGIYLAGLCQEEGLGGPVDVPAALRLYERAASLGSTTATHRLGLLLRKGNRFLKADPARARELLRRAADGGFAPSFAPYGDMLEKGEGGPADAAAAAHWRERARASEGR